MRRVSMKLALVFFLALTCSGYSQEEVGRFQIVSGTVQILSQQGNVTSGERVPVMIKIDTKTGETWILLTQFSDESSGQGWVALGDFFSLKTPKRKAK